ncbi:MAG: EamA family transporter [Actinomycetota bacterium]|nr:EamA family transporter [Actinomycetota bacterium]
MSRRGTALFAALSAIWGIPYLLIKVATSGVTPATLVFSRTALGGLLLLPLALARGEIRPALARWRSVALYTLVELAVPWYLLASAEQRLSSSLSALVVAAVPIVGAVLARTTGDRERLGPLRVAGLVIGLGGVAALVGFDVRTSELASVAALLVVVVGYALGPWIFHHQLSDLPSLGVVVTSLLACALVYAPVAALQAPRSLPPAKVLLSLAGLGVVCTATAFVAFFALISEVGPSRATVVTYVNPAIAVLLGVAILGERFTAATAAGFVLILVGSVLATRAPERGAGAAVDAAAP